MVEFGDGMLLITGCRVTRGLRDGIEVGEWIIMFVSE